jgi:hypothetical protein
MAHFAQLDENNVVTQVIVVANDELLLDGVESEAKGVIFCKSLFGEDTKWVQTSYNATIRKNYAGIGFKYDSALNAFIAPKPFNSWTLDEDTAQWEAPTPYPTDGKTYRWSEDDLTWLEVLTPEVA